MAKKTTDRKSIETLESRFCLSAAAAEAVAPGLHVTGQVTGQAAYAHQAEAAERTMAAFAPFARAGSTTVIAIANDYAAKIEAVSGIIVSWDSIGAPDANIPDVGQRSGGGHTRGGHFENGYGQHGFIEHHFPPGFGEPARPPVGEIKTSPVKETVDDTGSVEGGTVAVPPATGAAEVVVNHVGTGAATDALSVQTTPTAAHMSGATLAGSGANQGIFSQRFIAESVPSAIASAASSAVASLAKGPFVTGTELGGEVSPQPAQSSEALGAAATSAAAKVQAVLGSTIDAFAPTERIFTFAHLGSPLNFIGDSVASFVEDSASATITAVAGITNPSSAGPWALTLTVLAADAILLTVIHRNRKPRIAYACTRLGE